MRDFCVFFCVKSYVCKLYAYFLRKKVMCELKIKNITNNH